MYLGDPRENAIDIDNHVIWEEDKRIEQRFQWNALLTDLCDMSVEEYMKNPVASSVIEALDKISDELSGGTITVQPTTTPTPTPTPTPVYETVRFYYASLPRTLNPDEILLSMFTRAETDVNAPAMIQFTLGDPDQSDLDYITENNYSNESKIEVQERKANTYYLIVPDEFSTFGKIMIKEEGFILQEADIIRDLEMVNAPEGYKLLAVSDIDNFNFDWPDSENVKTLYEITLIKN